jgi:hypothetical protein
VPHLAAGAGGVQYLRMLEVACKRCDHRGRLCTDRLMAEHGRDIPIPMLLRIIAADCPRMQAKRIHEVGGGHLPRLAWVSAASWRHSTK